ncbi:MAG: ribonuclease E/G, partial [Dongiaceae bacterium]
MAKSMLIDATHPEETRVAVVDGRKLEEFDVEVATRRPLKGNIYLAKVTRVEPSLQAAFVEYGGNRHGFLAFSEIHPDYYRIPVADREALLREAAEALDDEDEIDAAADARTGRSTSHDDDHAHGDDHGHEDHHHDADHPPADHDSDVIVSESGEFVAAPGSGDGGIDSGGAGSGAATSSPDSGSASWVTEPAIMALDARRDVLLGDVPAESSFETSSSAGEIEIMSPANGEIIEVQLRDEAVDTVGGEEPAIQDDPEADEERARRRRQRNLRRYKIQEVIKRRQILLVQV